MQYASSTCSTHVVHAVRIQYMQYAYSTCRTHVVHGICIIHCVCNACCTQLVAAWYWYAGIGIKKKASVVIEHSMSGRVSAGWCLMSRCKNLVAHVNTCNATSDMCLGHASVSQTLYNLTSAAYFNTTLRRQGNKPQQIHLIGIETIVAFGVYWYGMKEYYLRDAIWYIDSRVNLKRI